MFDDFDIMRQIDEYSWYNYEMSDDELMIEEEISEEHDDYMRSCY